jgi:hypothetical protein
MEEIVDKAKEMGGHFGLLPPYSQGDETFTARCASVSRDRLPQETILVAVSGFSRKDVGAFLGALAESGFRNVVFPAYVGRQETSKLVTFWRHHFIDEGWYHIAGAMPEYDMPGRWTWSKEEL